MQHLILYQFRSSFVTLRRIFEGNHRYERFYIGDDEEIDFWNAGSYLSTGYPSIHHGFRGNIIVFRIKFRLSWSEASLSERIPEKFRKGTFLGFPNILGHSLGKRLNPLPLSHRAWSSSQNAAGGATSSSRCPSPCAATTSRRHSTGSGA